MKEISLCDKFEGQIFIEDVENRYNGLLTIIAARWSVLLIENIFNSLLSDVDSAKILLLSVGSNVCFFLKGGVPGSTSVQLTTTESTIFTHRR